MFASIDSYFILIDHYSNKIRDMIENLIFDIDK